MIAITLQAYNLLIVIAPEVDELAMQEFRIKFCYGHLPLDPELARQGIITRTTHYFNPTFMNLRGEMEYTSDCFPVMVGEYPTRYDPDCDPRDPTVCYNPKRYQGNPNGDYHLDCLNPMLYPPRILYTDYVPSYGDCCGDVDIDFAFDFDCGGDDGGGDF